MGFVLLGCKGTWNSMSVKHIDLMFIYFASNFVYYQRTEVVNCLLIQIDNWGDIYILLIYVSE